MSEVRKLLLPTLRFTRTVGLHEGDQIQFNDALEFGGYPGSLRINGIKKVEIFASGTDETAFINGLTVTYDGLVPHPVTHGITIGPKVGEVDIPSDRLLVGVYGQLKSELAGVNVGLISSIGFFLIRDTSVGEAQVGENKGPFSGTTEYQTSPWASFGQIIAFQGSLGEDRGLESIGFVKSDDPSPGSEII